jgi:hypothetical protein
MGRRYLAWHTVAPHADKKTFPDLETFMGVKAKAATKGGLDIDTAMRRWRAVMATVEAQKSRKPSA